MQIRNLVATTLLLSMSLCAVPALASTESTAKKATTTKITVSTHTIPVNHSGILNVKVTPNAASGTAAIYYKSVLGGPMLSYGTVNVTHGFGTAIRKVKDLGKFNVWVVYEGSTTFKPSTSNTEQITVTK